MNVAALIESLLFCSPRPVSVAALRRAADVSEEQLREAISELSRRYHPDSSGIVLRNVAGGYLLSTNPACAPVVEAFRQEAPPPSLSAAALEVLSCALYLGPLTRRDISAIRGVNSDAVVRSLIERDLLREAGSDPERPGSPMLLEITSEFLVATDADSPEDFPPLSELVSEEELSRITERLAAGERGS